MLRQEWCQTDENRRQIRDRLGRIRERVADAALKAGRHPEEIALMAVTKTMPASLVNDAIAEGITLLGENRAQELCARVDEYRLCGAEIHFIGHLQTNKVRKIVPLVSVIQSVDSLRLGQEISRCAQTEGKTMDVLVEINSGGEETKSGVSHECAEELVHAVSELPGLRVRGLMTIPPPQEDESLASAYFHRLYKLFIDIKHKKMDNVCMDILSMGMSADFELAILEGSTLVRIGSALFGPRQDRQARRMD